MTRTQDHHQRSASNTPASTACRNADQAPEAYGITEYLLLTNKLTPQLTPNLSAGRQHLFSAYRLKGMGSGTVTIKDVGQVDEGLLSGDDE